MLFAATIFVGATLLFACQPMIARMLLPLLGGAPAVWIVCSLCFQTLLLAGYAYAHFVGTRLPIRAQVILQLVLVGAVFLVMPVAVDDARVAPATSASATMGLLLVLLRAIGLPFFVLSTSSPLLQRWFAELGERDPYHLYAASNAGSMLALLGYPLAVEPLLAVRSQSRVLHAAFVGYAALVVVCAARAMRRTAPSPNSRRLGPPQARAADFEAPMAQGRPSWRARWLERGVWVGLSFAPSSSLLGSTEYVTTDIASVPLLWVLPLALYLTSFIVAFAKKQVVGPTLWSRATAVAAALVAALTLADVTGPPWLVIGAHMLLLFFGSVVCHRGLAERRPHVSRLTEFYLLLSVGGVLGGVFNGLVAPLVFHDLLEYPIAIGVICLGRAALGAAGRRIDGALGRDLALGLGLGATTYALVEIGAARGLAPRAGSGWIFGAALVLALAWSRRPVRYAVAVGALLLVGMSRGGEPGITLWAHRGPFGVLKVKRDREGRFVSLLSGRATRGRQALDPGASRVPLAYHHPTGPAGDVLGPLPSASSSDAPLPPRRVGIIGLGVGSLAAYARPGDDWTFFEINPAVVDVARRHFTYLSSAEQVASVHVEVGDARLRLRQGDAERFDVLVIDSLSSDAVPIHLVTREALAVYRRALRARGVILAHVSNEHVDLTPVVGALARQAGMVAIARRDLASSTDEQVMGKSSSEWVVLTESKGELDVLLRAGKEWHALSASGGQSVWTDDYANVLRTLRF